MSRKGNRSHRPSPPPTEEKAPSGTHVVFHEQSTTSAIPIPVASFVTQGIPIDMSEGRTAVLGFMDSLYAGCIAFALALVPQHTKGISELKGFEAVKSFFPLAVSVLWVIDDWICARLLLHHYGYPRHDIKATIRLVIDVIIAIISFFLVLFSIEWQPGRTTGHPVRFIGMFGAISLLGYIWAWLLRKEYNNSDKDIDIIKTTHKDPALVMVGFAIAAWMAFRNPSAPGELDYGTIIYWIAVIMPVIIFLTYKTILFINHWRCKHA